jgi:hypothetical protein
MKKIGPEGELTKIDGYLNWPIFREFRSTPQFSSAFLSIFGVAFEVEVRKSAEESVQRELEQKENHMPTDRDRK